MSRRLNNIHLHRGRLLERIAAQRVQLAQDCQPLAAKLGLADRALVLLQSGIAYGKKNPVLVAGVAGTIAVLKAKTLWRWTQRGLVAWRVWTSLRERIPALRGLSSKVWR